MTQCAKCGFKVSDPAFYCTNCGAWLEMKCPACNASIPNDAAFCPQCGAQLTKQIQTEPEPNQKVTADAELEENVAQVDPLERRLISILFADITGYSTLSEHLDPETLADIMNDAYPCLLEPIKAHNGCVVQVMGDGILAYFGVPLAREDDAERAVLAGLKIVAVIQKYAKKLKIEQGLDAFHVRVGINTGMVVIGEMNPNKYLEYIALGDAVNLAARLQQNAPEDGVVISHATYQYVRDLFDLQAQKPLTVKGRDQVEKTYLAKQAKPMHLRSQKRGVMGAAAKMIGREPEMAALKNLYQDVEKGGETAFVFISGDAGIGKTRLVHEFSSWLRSQVIQPTILRARAIESMQDVPYGILRNLFAQNFGILESDSSAIALEKFRKGTGALIEIEQADLIGQLVGFDFSCSPAISSLLGSSSFSEMSELYLRNYLGRLAEKPLVMLLEDLHWADQRTLRFITNLLSEPGGREQMQLMIVSTARPQFSEEHPEWGEGIPEFNNLDLRKLSRSQSRSLIDEILFRVEDIPETFYQCIVDEAGGNPFFIEEIIKMFIDEGLIEIQWSPWQIRQDKLATVQVPSTLKGILQARLDSLAPAEKLVAQRAAVIGKTFWDGALRVLTEDAAEVKALPARLEALRGRGLIYRHERSSIGDNKEYSFKHALFCDEAYETVLLKQRRRYHKEIAAWVQENAGDRLTEHLALIANHYLLGGETELAVNWLIKAGERVLNQCLMLEAKVLFEKALRLIDPRDIARMWKATLGHDEAVGMLGEVDARHADDTTLLNLATQQNDDKLLAEAYFHIGSQAEREGDSRAALRAFDQALEAAERTDDVMMRALILPMKVTLLSNGGELQAAGLLVEEALELAQQTENAEVLARTLTNLAPYYRAIGDLSHSVKLFEQQIAINQQQGNRLGETIGLINLGYFYLSLGHFKTSHELLERAYKTAQKLGARSCVAYSLLNLGLAKWRLGQTQAACETLGLSLKKLEALGDQRGLAARLFYLGLAYESGGNLTEAKKQFSDAIDAFKLIDGTAGIVEALAGIARLAIENGAIQEAKELALQIHNYLKIEGSEGFELPMLVYLSCVKVFEKAGDFSMLQLTLQEGLMTLEESLVKISEDNWKRIFSEEIPENMALLNYPNKHI